MSDTQDTDQNKGPDWRRLEQSRDKANQRADAWKSVAVDALVKASGFDVKDPVVGLLIDKFNTPDLDPSALEPTAFVDFAKQYKVEPPKVQSGPDPDTQQQIDQMQQQGAQPGVQTPAPPDAPPTPDQQAQLNAFMQMQQGAQNLNDAARNAPPPVNPSDPAAVAAQMEAQGNWAGAFDAKFEQTRQVWNAQPGASPHQGNVSQQGLPVHTPPPGQ